MKRRIFLAGLCLLLLSSSLMAQDFNDALLKAVQFYDANRCGPLAGEDNIFSDWRGACHTRDGEDVGADLTGGFHDAGDHVKFGLPQAYTAGILGWALYEFRDQIEAAGATDKLLTTLKYFTDYFIKSKVGNRFYYQIGEGEADHTYWGPPEEQSEDRPTYAWADASTPATDILSETSAALSLMYLNYRDIDSGYANKCLALARDLFEMAKSNLGRGNGQSFYQSSSMYDDLSWAATWLYVIDDDPALISDVKTWLQKPTQNGDVPLQQNHWTMCWDDMGLAVLAKLGMLTGDSDYIRVLEDNLDYWLNDLATTPGGMKYLNNWGVLRYNSAESMIALLYYGHTGEKKYLDFAQEQLEYILGDNPAGMSYIIGYGSNWAKHPHHRAANGYTYANGDNQKPAKHTITGALVGGPDQSDRYVDDVNQFQYTEVALDYNAGLVGALAGYLKYSGGIIETPTPVKPTPTPDETTPTPDVEYILGDVNNDGNRNIVDALLIAQKYVGLPVPTYVVPEEFGDINMDGIVNIVDALLIAQCYVGLPTAYC